MAAPDSGDLRDADRPPEAHRPSALDAGGTLSLLTPRQTEVFLLIGEGKSYAEIARALGVSRPTVTRHRNNVIRKLALATRAELLEVAVRVRLERNSAIPREEGP